MTPPSHVPALIVGAGPIGLACAISARRNGINALVVDAGAITDSIVRYPIGMTFFTTRNDLRSAATRSPVPAPRPPAKRR